MNSTVTALESFRLLGSTISQDLKWDTHFLHLLRKLNLPQELLKQSNCHHWIRPLHVNNCVVQLNYQIWPQKTTDSCQDCWENHWYKPPHSPRTVLIQSEQTGWQNHSGPLTFSTLPLWTVTVLSTLQSPEHQNGQTQKQFLPPSNPSHEHVTITWNTQHYYTSLFITQTYLHFKFAHIIHVHT